MARTSWAVASRKRKKRTLKKAKGYRGARRLQIVKAKETLMRAKAYATRDRKVRTREFRTLWIMRLNAAVREHGLSYNQFIAACRKAHVGLNRKQLSELAITDKPAFKQLVLQVAGAR